MPAIGNRRHSAGTTVVADDPNRTSASQNCGFAKLTNNPRFADDKCLLYSVSPRMKGEDISIVMESTNA
jgi:hypothetical protein